MKTSVEWLKEYSDIDVSAKELGDILKTSRFRPFSYLPSGCKRRKSANSNRCAKC